MLTFMEAMAATKSNSSMTTLKQTKALGSSSKLSAGVMDTAAEAAMGLQRNGSSSLRNLEGGDPC